MKKYGIVLTFIFFSSFVDCNSKNSKCVQFRIENAWPRELSLTTSIPNPFGSDETPAEDRYLMDTAYPRLVQLYIMDHDYTIRSVPILDLLKVFLFNFEVESKVSNILKGWNSFTSHVNRAKEIYLPSRTPIYDDINIKIAYRKDRTTLKKVFALKGLVNRLAMWKCNGSKLERCVDYKEQLREEKPQEVLNSMFEGNPINIIEIMKVLKYKRLNESALQLSNELREYGIITSAQIVNSTSFMELIMAFPIIKELILQIDLVKDFNDKWIKDKEKMSKEKSTGDGYEEIPKQLEQDYVRVVNADPLFSAFRCPLASCQFRNTWLKESILEETVIQKPSRNSPAIFYATGNIGEGSSEVSNIIGKVLKGAILSSAKTTANAMKKLSEKDPPDWIFSIGNFTNDNTKISHSDELGFWEQYYVDKVVKISTN